MMARAAFALGAVLLAGAASTADRSEGFGTIERLDPRLDPILARDAVLERVVGDVEWAEGPVWDTQSGSLLYSDVPRNAVYRWRPGEPPDIFLRPSGYSGSARYAGREPGSNGLAFDGEGRLVLAQHGDRRVARLERDGTVTVVADRFEGKRLNSPNDLAFSPSGALYFTDPPFGLPRTYDDPGRELAFTGVYRVDPAGSVRLVSRALDGPNGLAFSPDGRRLYVSNARAARPVWLVFDVAADGSVGPPREFANARAFVREGDGLPDGLKTDRLGHVFATGPGGVHIFAPDGTKLGRIVTGVPTGNVNWGDDGRTLYIAANHWICRIRTLTGR